MNFARLPAELTILLNTCWVEVPLSVKVQPPKATMAFRPEFFCFKAVRSEKRPGGFPSIGAMLKSPGVTYPKAKWRCVNAPTGMSLKSCYDSVKQGNIRLTFHVAHHALARSIMGPALIIADYARLHISTGRTRARLITITLAAIRIVRASGTELFSRTAKPEFAVEDVSTKHFLTFLVHGGLCTGHRFC